MNPNLMQSAEQAYDAYAPQLYRVAYAILQSREGAEDAVQETFLKAYRKLDGFRGEASERTWLMRIGETWHPFTVKRDKTPARTLTGTAAGADWSAAASLQMSAIDIKGELILSCPQDWVEIERTWENPEGLNFIGEWHVYMDGVRDEDGGVEWVSSGVDGQLTFGLCCKVEANVKTIQLVPVYSETGENMAEAITLKTAE